MVPIAGLFMAMDFTQHSAQFWNSRYQADDYWYGTEPNAFLAAHGALCRSGGNALVPGDGEGRNGVFLAQKGMHVTSVDLSEAGVRKTQKLAKEKGVEINACRADLMHWDWPVGTVDFLVSVFFHLAPNIRSVLHEKMIQALAPGGYLLIEAFSPQQMKLREEGHKGGPPDPDMLFSAPMLRQDFDALHPVLLEERTVPLKEGSGHDGIGAVTRGIFQKMPSRSMSQ